MKKYANANSWCVVYLELTGSCVCGSEKKKLNLLVPRPDAVQDPISWICPPNTGFGAALAMFWRCFGVVLARSDLWLLLRGWQWVWFQQTRSTSFGT